jgi:hypothetical protein
MVQAQRLREQGLPVADDEDEEMPVELDGDARRLAQLFRQEEEQRKTRPGKR